MKHIFLIGFLAAIGYFTVTHSEAPTSVPIPKAEQVTAQAIKSETKPEIVAVTPVVAVVEQPKPKPVPTGNCSLAYNYDWPQNVAYAVCMAESSGNQYAIGDSNTSYPSCGLMQIRTLPGRPSCNQLHDPIFNMQYAYNMWIGQGFKPWSAYTTGKYSRYL